VKLVLYLQNNTFYSNITKLTSEILTVKFAFIAELDSVKRLFTMKSFYGIDDFSLSNLLENAEFMVDKITNRVINYGDNIFIDESEIKDAFMGKFAEQLNINSALLIPLVHNNKQVTGVLACMDDKFKKFTQEEVKICEEIANRIIKAISRIEKNISERESYLEIIKSMIDIFESKNSLTRDHSKNVSRLAGRISSALEIPKEEEQEIRNSAYLHDIGKLGLSEDIITDKEHIKSHPVIGARIVSMVQELKKLAPAIRHHHENWNGTGYPDGLQGESIPLYSRIISVANNYDSFLKEYNNSSLAIDKMKESGMFDPNICEVLKNKIFNDVNQKV
jgi:putative nucleotidyltransferase with HDIG domain